MIGEISGRENLRRRKVWSGNSPVGEVFIGEASVGGLPLDKCQSGGTVRQSINFNNTLGNFLRKYVSIHVYFAHGDLQKGLFIVPLVKCFKADTLRRSH